MVLAQLSAPVNTLEEDESVPNDFSEELCDRLRRNDPTLITMRCPSANTFDACDANFTLLGRSLDKNTHLLSLRLQCFTRSTLTPQGVESLARGVCQSQLEYFIIDGECPVELQQSLLLGIRLSSSIRVLSIKFSAVNATALMCFLSAQHQATFSRLTDLGLQMCTLEHEQKRMLLVGLGTHRSIKNLSLHACGLSDDDLAHFVHHWEHDSPIQEFDLRANQIGPRGAQVFMNAVRHHLSLSRLSFPKINSLDMRDFN